VRFKKPDDTLETGDRGPETEAGGPK